MTSLELASGGTAEFSEGDLYFIGNATTLIRFGGLTILTDPAFLHKGEHVYLGHGIWARREVEPACQIADLPPIDLVILSHYHGDHFDDVAARDLDKDLPIKTEIGGVVQFPLREVLKQMKADEGLRSVPVVMLTSSREESDLLESYRLGVNAYVVKPVDFREFIGAVKNLGLFWAVVNQPPPGSMRKIA